MNQYAGRFVFLAQVCSHEPIAYFRPNHKAHHGCGKYKTKTRKHDVACFSGGIFRNNDNRDSNGPCLKVRKDTEEDPS